LPAVIADIPSLRTEGGMKGVIVPGGAVLEVQEHGEPDAGCDTAWQGEERVLWSRTTPHCAAPRGDSFFFG
jgi:hypothetical protein